MIKHFISLSICILLTALCSVSAQTTYAFAERDTTLHLDLYSPAEPNGYTVIHIFGGGFVGGYRASKWETDYCHMLAEQGYTAVAIDYRLGLRGVGNVGIGNMSAIENAFYIAVEDCSDAIRYLVENADKLAVDPQKIIIEGSSAGAITALMTDYARCNGLDCARQLPDGWQPAAIVAYSGAIYSKTGKAQWTRATPAPTLMFHGTADKIVPYKKLQFGKLGIFGADNIAKQMNKQKLPYQIYRYTALGHEVSVGGPLTIDYLNLFVKQYVTEHKSLHIDITISDDSIPPSEHSKKTLNDLYSPKKRSDL